MAPCAAQYCSAIVLFAVSSGLTAASPADSEMHAPAYPAAYEEKLLAARSYEHPIERRDFEALPDLVDDLLGLLHALTRYHQPDAQPSVFRVTRAEIEDRMCGGAACPVRAWYLPEQGIYLEDNLHPETDLFDRSVLLHELVHYLQELHGEGAELDACNRWYQREVQAYALQNRYLALAGSQLRVNQPAYPCREESALRGAGMQPTSR
jgi:hypothetical protein